jgi:hypothetical protein
MLLVRDVFGQSGCCDGRQPVEDCLAPDTDGLTVSIEVRFRDFIGMKFQYQMGRQTSAAGSPQQVLGRSITMGCDASPKMFLG